MDVSTRMAFVDLPVPDEASSETEAAARPLPEGPAPLFVERVSSRSMLAFQAAWADLVARAIEANVFLEPAFFLPLIQHVAWTRRPDFLLVWERDGPTSFGRLLGLLPLAAARGLYRTDRIARAFDHNQMVRGAPLLDRERGTEAFDAMLTWLRDDAANPAALLITAVCVDGGFLATATAGREDEVHRLGEHKRAVLRRRAFADAPMVACFTSAKRRKEMGRQRRRLSEAGERRYTSARSPGEIARATERFLVLEQKGWKGARGTAMLMNPTLATFTRSMTRLMAHEGKCRIDAIEIDGVAVAMGIILTVGDQAHFWKTAFDETYAPLSPGVQFAHELTRVQFADDSIAITDSCAVPDHPMIDRLWPDRLAVTDLMIDLRAGNRGAFAWSCRIERLRRAIKAKAKALRKRLRSPKRPR